MHMWGWGTCAMTQWWWSWNVNSSLPISSPMLIMPYGLQFIFSYSYFMRNMDVSTLPTVWAVWPILGPICITVSFVHRGAWINHPLKVWLCSWLSLIYYNTHAACINPYSYCDCKVLPNLRLLSFIFSGGRTELSQSPMTHSLLPTYQTSCIQSQVY